MEEIEVKFLSIDTQRLEEKLHELGAQKVFDRLYKRRVFDYPDMRLDKQGAWIRLRDEGEHVTLTYKQRVGMNTTIHGDSSMQEIEIIVDDFDKTVLFLTSIGLSEKFYQENRRIRYVLGSIHFDIDFWPLLDPYLEIEASSWEEIDKAIITLGFNNSDKKICSTNQIYRMKGIEPNDYKIVTFHQIVKKTPIPQ